MKKRLLLSSLLLVIFFVDKSYCGNGQVGWWWKDGSLPYDTEFSYFFDVAVYPEGIFLDTKSHRYAYVTGQNKHITFNRIPYGVEAVISYRGSNNQLDAILWPCPYAAKRFLNHWIDSDASPPAPNSPPDSEAPQYWKLSTLERAGYLTKQNDGIGDALKFLRIQEQTIFISESQNPVRSTWENRFYLYNFRTQQWDKKLVNTFVLPASREEVRDSTFNTGSGIWSGMLEVGGQRDPNDPDHGTPPVKDIVYMNRSIKVIDHGSTFVGTPDASMNNWVEPHFPYKLLYKSTPNNDQYVLGWAGNGAMPRVSPTPEQKPASLASARLPEKTPQPTASTVPTHINQKTTSPVVPALEAPKVGTLVADTQIPLILEGKSVGLMTLKEGSKVSIIQVLPDGFMVGRGEEKPFKVNKAGLKLNGPE